MRKLIISLAPPQPSQPALPRPWPSPPLRTPRPPPPPSSRLPPWAA